MNLRCWNSVYNFQGILTVFPAKQNGYNCFLILWFVFRVKEGSWLSWLVFVGTFLPQVRITLVKTLLWRIVLSTLTHVGRCTPTVSRTFWKQIRRDRQKDSSSPTFWPCLAFPPAALMLLMIIPLQISELVFPGFYCKVRTSHEPFGFSTPYGDCWGTWSQGASKDQVLSLSGYNSAVATILA